MLVSIENQDVSAKFELNDAGLHVHFEDPSYVHADMLILHSSNSRVGAILHEGYIGLCALPQTLSVDALRTIQTVTLLSTLPNGEIFRLEAPLCVERR